MTIYKNSWFYQISKMCRKCRRFKHRPKHTPVRSTLRDLEERMQRVEKMLKQTSKQSEVITNQYGVLELINKKHILVDKISTIKCEIVDLYSDEKVYQLRDLQNQLEVVNFSIKL